LSKRDFLRAAGAMAAGTLLQACGGGGGGDSCGGVAAGNDTLLQRLLQDSSLSLFAQAVEKAGLNARYSGGASDLTLFAADNAAMNRLGSRLGLTDGSGLVNGLTSTQWAAILNFSTLPRALARCALDDIARRDRVDERPETLHSFENNLQPLIPVLDNGSHTIWDGIGRVTITYARADIGASNGVLHVLTDPVLPRGVLTVAQMLRASVDAFESFAAQMVANTSVSSQLDGNGPFTVYAPGYVTVPALTAAGVRRYAATGRLDSDDFFAGGATRAMTSLASTSLTLRQGPPVTLSSPTAQAQVIDVDFWASNGVIHTIDRLL
jgi:uncharacterized surface protein with fasciclin (FAS1) repeats